jgi:glycosyltransferase involved in cell wall biosynthesis
MKILFLTDNFPPEINAPANRTYEHCREWVKKGAEVTIITCAPNFPKGAVFEGYKNKLYQKEEIDGIQVIRVWSYISANSGTIRRILDYLSFGFSAFWAGLFQKTDLIIGTSPQFFTAVAAWQLSFFKRKKWVMEVRDLWPESIIAVGAMSNKAVIAVLEWMELRMYRSADKLVVVTDTFKEKIRAKGIPAKKIKVYKNGVILDKYRPAAKNPDLVKQYNLEGKRVISYIGTHGMAHGLSFILDCANTLQLKRPDLVFMFVGDGAQKNELMEKAGKESITNVIFVDSVPKEEVLDYLNLMDIALVNLKKSDTFKTVIPSKIFEAAAVEKPILLGLEGETKGMIEAYHAGEVFEPENQDSFMEALERLCGVTCDLEPYIKGCRKLAWDFQRKKIAASLLEELKLI